MAFKRSVARGSTFHKKQINPIRVHIAYEGAKTEAEYLKALECSIPKQFNHLLELIPVDKSSTNSSPEKVYNDLANHLDKLGVNLNRSSDDIAFMIIDKDHHFNDTHSANTRLAIRDAKRKGIIVLCTAPAFELWLLLHYMNIKELDDEFKAKALENRNDFLKKEFKDVNVDITFDALIDKTSTALINEKVLFESMENKQELLPPEELCSQVGRIFHVFIENNIVLPCCSEYMTLE